MNLVSWNVNGIRSVAKKGFTDFLIRENPDIVCLQEVRAELNQIERDWFPGYQVIWNSAAKKGYSGTAIITKSLPTEHSFDFSLASNEGRIIAARFENFWLVNVYTPNAGRDLGRLKFRELEWDPAFKDYIKSLEVTAPVIICGDLNVAHQEIDLANPKSNHKTAGFTKEERLGITNLLESGYVDTFRYFHPDQKDKYTWWSNRPGVRDRNIGWRIDYFILSNQLKGCIKAAEIYDQVFGSDHCPIALRIEL
jgi:exodeoxyribonuclease-3